MPPKRIPLLLMAALLGAAFVVVGSTNPAQAATPEPPFELRFPQELTGTDWGSTFGAARSGGRRHKGNDLMAPKMTHVYAAADGVVVTVSDGPSSGRYLTIEHDSGWSTTYMHLNNDDPGTDNGSADWSLTLAPGVQEGASVTAGQLIAFVGDSGNAEWTGSHTHFELRLDNRAIDPYNILVESWERDYHRIFGEPWRPTPRALLDAQV
jgi:murein DD-endopeptidase MepM/ murein hydrolase activator NlpD